MNVVNIIFKPSLVRNLFRAFVKHFGKKIIRKKKKFKLCVVDWAGLNFFWLSPLQQSLIQAQSSPVSNSPLVSENGLGVGTQHFLTICLWHTIFVDGGCYFCWCRVNVDHVGLLALQELSKEPILLQLENLSILVNNSLLIVITWLATYNSKFFPGLDSFSSCKPSCVFFNHPYWKKKKKLQALHLFP